MAFKKHIHPAEQPPELAATSPLSASDGSARRAFEDWCEAEHHPFEYSKRFAKDEDGEYEDAITHAEWQAWQAGVSFQQNERINHE